MQKIIVINENIQKYLKRPALRATRTHARARSPQRARATAAVSVARAHHSVSDRPKEGQEGGEKSYAIINHFREEKEI